MSFTILIVDDSKLARMSVAKSLTALHPDWTRLEATNADEALALSRTSRPDLALLDFNMPGRDGLALAAEILTFAPHMPLAIVSANLQTEIVSRAEAIGATFLGKPLTQDALAAFLVDAVQHLKSAAK
ncbi:MAG TPA: response regulator transcription factor [Phenylobacterium sp.]|jgi:CheY-like chemotaxis protein|uniref:response regulator transcription factor n=1 Tax=Phenylobacterium sp. TaxID=1871053 RepID=UPI002D627682|nr:response regulator transcription factor [Phenylobacterium sp.]HZZ70368.1 response regulator transcription factor [Phenylobacterium sp.]